ncbi:PREDICTED: ras-related protein RABD2a-like [Amphimedon queenslandica]|uniref:Uncharacterized protein n=1 Tax=Amphimedon queenslandica TaxID=400682 RepID=A0A1X7TPE3_AMPQE|nr:PREDICTED: ras-related protein RABD2a-like [Amphimedon queenslandica]|eukprot:XP_019858588.1 PREDICTED: ras-related protein RABD2a-like [Amphimedon queenslandica]
MSEVPVTHTFKILVLGDSGVGKTSLIKYYTDGEASKSILSTIGIDYSDINVTVRGITVKLRVWDTAGQERFHTFTKQFFRGTQAVILVYDTTSLKSFQTLSVWIKMLSDFGLTDLDAVIVGNKSDLPESAVPDDLAKALATNISCDHILTSTVTGSNVKKTFFKIGEALIHSHNIFAPGLEAAAAYEGTGNEPHSGSVSRHRERIESIVLSKEHYDKKSKEKKPCC